MLISITVKNSSCSCVWTTSKLSESEHIPSSWTLTWHITSGTRNQPHIPVPDTSLSLGGYYHRNIYVCKEQANQECLPRLHKLGAEEGLIQIHVPIDDIYNSALYSNRFCYDCWAFQDKAWNGFVDHRQLQNRGTYIWLIVFYLFLQMFAKSHWEAMSSASVYLSATNCETYMNFVWSYVIRMNCVWEAFIHHLVLQERKHSCWNGPFWSKFWIQCEAQVLNMTAASIPKPHMLRAKHVAYCSIKDKQHCRCTLHGMEIQDSFAEIDAGTIISFLSTPHFAHWIPSSIPPPPGSQPGHLPEKWQDMFWNCDSSALEGVHFSEIGRPSKPLKCALSVSNDTSDLLNGRVIMQVLRLLDAFAFDRFQVLSKKGASPSLENFGNRQWNWTKSETNAIH